MGYIGLTPLVAIYQLRKEDELMPTMDYSKLCGRIKECGYTQKSLAKVIEISESHFCQKLSGKYPFTQKETRSVMRLKFPSMKLALSFFLLKVEIYQLSHEREI